jgi:hypothetical protein
VLRLDQSARTATLVDQYGPRAPDFDALYMGSIEPLAGGNEFVGWGSTPFFSEYSASGKLLLDARLPGSDLSYRARRAHWVGFPSGPPSGAARHEGNRTVVYASWNGATRVAAWRVLGSSAVASLGTLATSPKSGFETAIPVPQGVETFTLQALDRQGHVIGSVGPFSAQ